MPGGFVGRVELQPPRSPGIDSHGHLPDQPLSSGLSMMGFTNRFSFQESLRVQNFEHSVALLQVSDLRLFHSKRKQITRWVKSIPGGPSAPSRSRTAFASLLLVVPVVRIPLHPGDVGATSASLCCFYFWMAPSNYSKIADGTATPCFGTLRSFVLLTCTFSPQGSKFVCVCVYIYIYSTLIYP